MHIVLNPVGFDPVEWRELFKCHAPWTTLDVIPDVTAPDGVDALLTMSPPDWPASRFPNLRCAIQLGHGIDGLVRSGAVPDHVPIVRLVDETIRVQVANHALAAVLRYHCKIDDYDDLKRQHVWRRLGTRHPSETRVGVLGLGHLGSYIVDKLRILEFQVGGWSRSPKTIDGVETFTGKDGFETLLGSSDVVLCVLPLYDDTRYVLDSNAFATMKSGGFVINLGRGGLLNQEDLLAALEMGYVSGAYLDVFDPEPLPPAHPFWDHPKITMTPHAASETRPSSCIGQIVDNITRLKNGEPLLNVIDRNRGY